jgi:hypothetical protein
MSEDPAQIKILGEARMLEAEVLRVRSKFLSKIITGNIKILLVDASHINSIYLLFF